MKNRERLFILLFNLLTLCITIIDQEQKYLNKTFHFFMLITSFILLIILIFRNYEKIK
jgi:hypothetical protein